MTYQIPRGTLLGTAWSLCNLLAESETLQGLLDVSDAAGALGKITTYTEEGMPYPRVLILERDIRTETDSLGQNILNVNNRGLDVIFFVYSLTDDDLKARPEWSGQPEDIPREQDHHNYINHMISLVLRETMLVTSTPGFLSTYDPVIMQPEMIPSSERIDDEEREKGSDARRAWYAGITFQVR